MILTAILLFVFNQFLFVGNAADLASFMIEILVGLLPISLSFREKDLSYWLSLLNVTLIAVGSVLVSENVEVYGLLIVFLLALIFSLNAGSLFFLTKGGDEANRQLPPRFFLGFFKILPVGLIAGALIFFLFPRVKNLNSWFGFEGQKNRTGYTGSVSLAGGREIGESDALVFLVESKSKLLFNAFEDDVLFRGNSLSQFDGVNWYEIKAPKRIFAYSNSVRVSKSVLGKVHELTIYKEPHYTTPMFYPGVLLTIEGENRKVGGIFIDELGNLSRGKSDMNRYSYQMTISETYRINAIGDMKSSSFYPAERNSGTEEEGRFRLNMAQFIRYTQVPTEIQDSDYFKKFRVDVDPNYETKKVAALAYVLRNYFEKNYEASLVNQFSSADTFKAFLSSDRRGHCEYFSTAAALYFRSIGVPSRIVLGYRGGAYNKVSELFEVREKNAHAWVELFVPKFGWISFDPTPTSLVPSDSSSSSSFRQYLSAATFWFNRYVVDYDRNAQIGLFRSIQDFKVGSKTNLKFAFNSAKSWVFPLVLIGVIFLLSLALRKIRQARNPYRRFPKFFQIFMEKVEKAGYSIRPGESLLKFHDRLIVEGVDEKTVKRVSQVIEEFAYAPDSVEKKSNRNKNKIENAQYQQLRDDIKKLKIHSNSA